ncbi:hypothetical protein [Paenibacillus sp. XY044]|uniref:hypothetical protein n=1 Tax=Paenibacillus sp. XY044 TaxID=2026089 RepID=UPI000B992249|nr:hypothetical protein [Paenibacillus sp. XY044]OZB90735.1 hypothetical protein CJP46_31985 [Paenibacillus sp. XY044]
MKSQGNDRPELLVEAEPGLIRAQGKTGEGRKEWTLGIPVTLDGDVTGESVVERLYDCPADLYLLLQGSRLSWLDELFGQATLTWGEAVCSCGEEGCPHAAESMPAIRQRLAEEPLLMLTLLGLPREELLGRVFGDWADSLPPGDVKLASGDLSSLEEKGKGGPSPGEWLAEAAQQGMLHEPGAPFREVAVHLEAVPAKEMPEEDWSGLLPKVTAARQVIRSIKSQTAARAKEQLKRVPSAAASRASAPENRP